MVIALRLLRLLFLASLVLAEGPETARAETVDARLRVSAEPVIRCTLDARVPRAGTPERSRGTARFSVTCTQGAAAIATACPQTCEKKPTAQRSEYRIGPSGDGATVATVLF